jgi:hypothetical protein
MGHGGTAPFFLTHNVGCECDGGVMRRMDAWISHVMEEDKEKNNCTVVRSSGRYNSLGSIHGTAAALIHTLTFIYMNQKIILQRTKKIS